MLLAQGFAAELTCSDKILCNSADKNVISVYNAIKESFKEKKNIVAVLPMGVVVWAIEPVKKTKDPWVVSV